MWYFLIITLILVAIAWEPVRRYRKKQKGAFIEPAKDTGLPFPCVIEGTVAGSPMPDRVEALRIEAASKGIVITGDYAADVAAQGGEMHLVGTGFKFTIDAAGQIVNSASWVNLFLENWPCEGGMNPNGTLGISVVVTDKVTGAVAKVGVKGRIVDGQLIGGEVRKGVLPHIWGALNGTYRKVAP